MRRKGLAVLLAAALVLSLAPAAAWGAEAEAEEALTLGAPSGVIVLEDGSLLVTDVFNKVVWSVKGGKAAIYAGRIGVKDIYGEPVGGYADGTALTATFQSPWGIVPWLENGYAVSDSANNIVRWTDGKGIYTAVGSTNAGYTGGVGVKALFNNPTGLAVDAAGALYVADTGNNVIRKVSLKGEVSTYAGSREGGRADGSLTAARFNGPTGLCWYDGALYVADSGNHRICKIESGRVSTVAGGAAVLYEDSDVRAGDYRDGGVNSALFNDPQGIAVGPDGVIYVADTGNSAIRRIEGDKVSTLLRLSGADEIFPVSPRGLALAGSTLHITDPFSGALLSVDLAAAARAASEAVPGASYKDVAAADWYHGAVTFVSEMGLFEGVGAATFGPGLPVDRAMFTTVLSRLQQAAYPNAIIAGEGGFADVAAEAYYADAVAWAAGQGIVTGFEDGNFRPAAAITREQMAAMLYRYAVWAGFDGAGAAGSGSAATTAAALRDFPDVAAVSVWAEEAMAWALANDIIKGMDGNLNPRGTATRAQAAQIFQNFYEAFLN